MHVPVGLLSVGQNHRRLSHLPIPKPQPVRLLLLLVQLYLLKLLQMHLMLTTTGGKVAAEVIQKTCAKMRMIRLVSEHYMRRHLRVHIQTSVITRLPQLHQ